MCIRDRAGGVGVAGVGVVHQLVEQRRQQEQVGDALAFDGGECGARVEVVEQDDGAARVQGAVGHQARSVREGGADQLPAGGLRLLLDHAVEPARLVEGGADALGVAGRTAGVADGAHIVGPGPARVRLVGLPGRQLQQIRAHLGGAEYEDLRHRCQFDDLGGAFGMARVDDQGAGLDIADDGGLGLGGQLVVEVIDPGADQVGRVTGGDDLREVAAQQRDGRSAVDAAGAQGTCHAVDQ